jgi:hypothetical protein
MSKVMDAIQQQLESALDSSTTNAEEAKAAIGEFLTEIEPEVDSAVAAGDTQALAYLRDAVASRAGRIALSLTYKERQIVAEVVSTAIRVAIMLAAAAA